jgi:TonB family protein
VFRIAAVCLVQILLFAFACVAHAENSSQSQQPRRPYGVPEATEEARARGINGTITVEFELLADGNIGKTQIIQGLSGGLNEATEEAVRKTIFLPAIKNRQFVTQSTGW